MSEILGYLNPCGGGDPIPLLGESLLVGRRSSCDITLRFPNVSSRHCQLEFEGGYWRVRDLSSRNGVRVNGERCDTKWIMPGDILRVAKHEFAVEYESGGGPVPEEESPMAVGLLEKAGLSRKPIAAPAPPPERQRIELDPSDATEDDMIAGWLNDDEQL